MLSHKQVKQTSKFNMVLGVLFGINTNTLPNNSNSVEIIDLSHNKLYVLNDYYSHLYKSIEQKNICNTKKILYMKLINL